MSQKPVDTKKDLLCGFASGNLTGLLFLLPEYLKVAKQIKIGNPNVSILKSLSDKGFWENIKRGTISFPLLVGFVGAAEFACNDKIREYHGKTLGIIASAISGAAFLTPGDHFMLRKEKFGNNFTAAFRFLKSNNGFFVGNFGVVLRETIFMTNMIYIGPWTGNLMKKLSGSNNKEEVSLFWNFLGRSTSGVLCTILSHPFDVASRTQQIKFGEVGQKMNLFQVLLDLHREHIAKNHETLTGFLKDYPWFRGATCRMWLGTFGGATLGGFYEYFSKQYDHYIH